jgi:hypothetical protein
LDTSKRSKPLEVARSHWKRSTPLEALNLPGIALQ